MSADYPKIRYLDAFPLKDDLICVRDPLGFSEKILVLSPPLFFVCTLCDGKRSLADIERAFKQQFGQILPMESLEELLQKLDSCLFLDNEAFAKVKAQVIDEFKQVPLRKSVFAGQAYEAEPKKLCEQLDSYFLHEDGPGALNVALYNLPEKLKDASGKLKGVMAPHIDLKRGGTCFAWSYSALAHYSTAKTFILLGIAHAQTARRYVLTRKNFETPLGTVTADNEFIDKLVQKCSSDFFTDEFVHRNEHSLEFQTLFLRYLFPAHFDIKIVPILCSSFHTFIQSKQSPLEDPEVKEFITALKQTVSEYPEEVCFIAGVDLSHIGQKFGHNLTLSQALLEKAEADDRSMLEKIVKLDAEGFFQLIGQEEDRRNVCGVSAIYTLLHSIAADTATAQLLRYEMAVEKETQSLVGFAAAAFYEQ